MMMNSTTSTMDCETQKGGRALLSGGCQYLSIRKEIKGREFWRCCLQTCVARAKTVGDQLEAALKKKYKQMKHIEVQQNKDRMSAGQVSISEYLDAIGHL